MTEPLRTLMDYLYTIIDKKDVAVELLEKIEEHDNGKFRFPTTCHNIKYLADYIFDDEYKTKKQTDFFDGRCLTEEEMSLFQSLVQNEKIRIYNHVNFIYEKAQKIQKYVDIPFHDICRFLHILTDKKPEDIQKLMSFIEQPKPINHNKLKVNRHD